jgi:hypothetical protein
LAIASSVTKAAGPAAKAVPFMGRFRGSKRIP